MADLQKAGPVFGGTGAIAPFTAGFSGQSRTSDAHGRWLQAVMENRAFYLSAGAAAATAYTGGAAGTPLLAIHNPANSGRVLAVSMVGIGSRVAASAAGTAGFALWAGPSVLPTGTQTPPTGALSQAVGGSYAKGFVNAALTGSTALALALPLVSYYWATAASALLGSGMYDVGGLVFAAPGNQIALGATAALTSATYDVAMYWEELPYLT